MLCQTSGARTFVLADYLRRGHILRPGGFMSKKSERYVIGTVDLSDIRNRNESRIVEKMRAALEELGNPEIPEKSLRDAYALALNLLPARYAQNGTIVLRDPVRDDDLREAVGKALSQVLTHPKI